jgi:SagB-type dehydrogenase family enzyme
MLAVSAASGLPAETVLGFVDGEVNELLALDTRHEVSLCLVPIGRTSEISLPESKETPPLGLEIIPLSQREVEYPAMLEMHGASSLASEEEVARWREGGRQLALSAPAAGEEIRLAPLPKEEQPTDTIEQVILRRGSTRTFDPAASITRGELSTILDSTTRGLPADFLADGAQLNDIYLVAHAVQGLAPGAYFFHRGRNTLQLLRHGEFRAETGRLGLEQELPADACVDVFFLADLNRILDAYGNRGYRAVQLEAGAIGGKMYLAAYTLRLGASGLTFFDDEVVEFFSPHAKEKSAIFLLAIGKPLKRT